MKTNINGNILNYLVNIGIVLTIAALVAFPFFLNLFFEKCGVVIEDGGVVRIITAGTYICSVPYIIALFYLKEICRQFSCENPFSEKNIKSFRAIKTCAFAEILIIIAVLTILYFVIVDLWYAAILGFAFIAVFICMAAGLISEAVAAVLEKAAAIKEENDLTF